MATLTDGKYADPTGRRTLDWLIQKMLSGSDLDENENALFSESAAIYCDKERIHVSFPPRCTGMHFFLRRSLKKHVMRLRRIAVALADSELLSFYVESYSNYLKTLRWINPYARHYHPLHFTSPGGYNEYFHLKGVEIWNFGIYENCKKKIVRLILTEIDKDRRGEQVSKTLISRIIRSLPSDRNNKGYFKSKFLQGLENFYKTQNYQPPASLITTGYIKWTENVVQNEIQRCREYFHEGTHEIIARIVAQSLLNKNNEGILLKEFTDLLTGDKIDELSSLTTFLFKYDHDLENFLEKFDYHIYCMGSRALRQVCNEAQSSTKLYVETIDALLSKCDYLLENAFRKHSLFTQAGNNACKRFINANAVTEALGGSLKSSVILAKYSDLILRRHLKTAGNVAELLQIVMKVFPFLEDKDAFLRKYGSFLARRLVGNKPFSEHHERCMINFFEEKCDISYPNTYNRMLADVQSSQGLNKEFCNWLRGRSNEKSTPGFPSTTIVVFQASCSRFFKRETDLMVPPEVSAYQMAILMLFNNADTYTVGELQAQTNIDEIRLIPLLEGLLKTRILEVVSADVAMPADNGGIEEMERGIKSYSQETELFPNLPILTMNTKLALCKTYYNDQSYVDLNIPVRLVKKKEEVVDEESLKRVRMNSIQCRIVQMLKTRRRLAYQDLKKEILEQSFTTFQPTTHQIKLSIEKLIENEYVKRDPADIAIIEYID
ncbi:unnamed protein product [Rodentolepis nana]|uniref:CULLIN_2 domain-containing protein n=1 Tax=Rodentolepis nana TaxID=102285 RepID=A0A0R3TLS0_RODNA|nr:unnamed protein product [Rodentolepis nana]